MTTGATVAQNVVPFQQVIYLFLASMATILAGGLWLIRTEATRIAREEVLNHSRTPHVDVSLVERLSDHLDELRKSVDRLSERLARQEGLLAAKE